MAIDISKQSDGSVKFDYGGTSTPTYITDLEYVTVQESTIKNSDGSIRQQFITISTSAGIFEIPYSQLATINGVAKPGTIALSVTALATTVFNVSGGGGGSGTVTSVAGVSPVAGNVPLSATDVGAVPIATYNSNKIATDLALTNKAQAIKNSFGLLFPQFKTTGKFYNMGSTLTANPLVIHTSGIGLASSALGTVCDGYLKLPFEVEARNATRTDWLLDWDTTEVGASITVGIGLAATGWGITIANTGGNVVVTFPSGATKSSALTGTVRFSLSIASGNYGVTCSAHLIVSAATTLLTTNVFRVPVYEYAKASKINLWSAYFKTNTVSSKIIGFLHCAKGWNGDPFGQLLTRTMIVNGAGYPNEHDNMIIVPERASVNTMLKAAHFFHGRTQTIFSFIDIAIRDSGETARQLLSAGYAVIGTSGGVGNTTIETDWWGNATGTFRAGEVYEALAKNVLNVGNEYLDGDSMGGMSAVNYTLANIDRIKVLWLCCPVLNAEETGVRSVQGDATLQSTSQNAYGIWRLAITATTNDPQTDDVNYRQVSVPGGLPIPGILNYTVTTVTSAVTNNALVALTSGTRIYPGDILTFKNTGTEAFVLSQAIGLPNSVTLDRPVTVSAGEQVSILRQDGKPGYDFKWTTRPPLMWTAGTSTVTNFYRRISANPLGDIIPNNPLRNVDSLALNGIKVRVMTGGDGSAGSNDGILNNQQMYDFVAAMNAITAGSASVNPGTGTHTTAGTLSATDTLAFFNSNP